MKKLILAVLLAFSVFCVYAEEGIDSKIVDDNNIKIISTGPCYGPFDYLCITDKNKRYSLGVWFDYGDRLKEIVPFDKFCKIVYFDKNREYVFYIDKDCTVETKSEERNYEENTRVEKEGVWKITDYGYNYIILSKISEKKTDLPGDER